MKTRHQAIKDGYISQTSIRGAIELCQRADNRKLKPEYTIPIEEDTDPLLRQAEREYSARPKENNIPALKPYDYAQDVNSWTNPFVQLKYS